MKKKNKRQRLGPDDPVIIKRLGLFGKVARKEYWVDGRARLEGEVDGVDAMVIAVCPLELTRRKKRGSR